MLTEKECIKSQRRPCNAFGDRWPYKGWSYDKARLGEALPEGWVWVHIPTWGVHIRKADDIEWRDDL